MSLKLLAMRAIEKQLCFGPNIKTSHEPLNLDPLKAQNSANPTTQNLGSLGTTKQSVGCLGSP